MLIDICNRTRPSTQFVRDASALEVVRGVLDSDGVLDKDLGTALEVSIAIGSDACAFIGRADACVFIVD